MRVGTMTERIKMVRRHLGLTQEEFAKELGVTSRTIQGWEAGTSAPQAAALRRLSVLARQPIAWFYEEEAVA